MSWLDNVGKFMHVFAPVIQTGTQVAAAATGIGTIAQIGQAVVMAEQIGNWVKTTNGTKLDKAAMVTPVIEQAVLTSPWLAGKKIVNNELFQQSLKQLNDAMVNIAKSAEEVPEVKQ